MWVQTKDKEQKSNTVIWHVTLPIKVQGGCFQNPFLPCLCGWLWLPVWAMQCNMMWCEVGSMCFSTAHNSPKGSKAWRQAERSQMWKAVWPCAYRLEVQRLEWKRMESERQFQLSLHDQCFYFSRHIKSPFHSFKKMIFLSHQQSTFDC